MGLKVRLQRNGRTGRPHYRLVVAETRAARDGAPIEILGHYDPRAGAAGARIDGAKARAWIERGARVSPTAARLLRRAGVLTEGESPSPRRPAASAPSA